ncbi:hypothetical protein Taro_032968 [Colocasia esculenta]|uniref:Uncharacterized protein n=1 Tax=Colocasia esculenta TaxID=4460 RepID=A0A843VSN5_COLES|nr:hypothetical protein [Colocasia esculenta]
MVAWVARATTERGEYELDEEADDPEDPPRLNTFLARAVAEATVEEEGDRGNVGQPYSPHYEMDPEAEVDLLGDIELELVERRGGKKGATIVEDPLDIADAETLDPNAEDETLSPLDSPRLSNNASHDSMTTGGSSLDAGGDGGGNGRGVGGDGGQGEGDGDSGQGGGGGGMTFTEEQFYRGATQDTSHGAPIRYNKRQKFRLGSQARGSPVDSHSYDTMISDFERMSTQESVGSHGGHSYHPESSSIDYSSGYGLYSGYTATVGYLGPSPYMYPPPAFSVSIPVQVFALVEDVQMAQLNVVRPGCQVITLLESFPQSQMSQSPCLANLNGIHMIHISKGIGDIRVSDAGRRPGRRKRGRESRVRTGGGGNQMKGEGRGKQADEGGEETG